MQPLRAILRDADGLAWIARPLHGLALLFPEPEQVVAPVPREREREEAARDSGEGGGGRVRRRKRRCFMDVLSAWSQPGEERVHLVVVRRRADARAVGAANNDRAGGGNEVGERDSARRECDIRILAVHEPLDQASFSLANLECVLTIFKTVFGPDLEGQRLGEEFAQGALSVRQTLWP